jgi:hypothetical protein
MGERMIGFRVSITRYIADEPLPGVVESEFQDAHGRRWRFVEKTAHVSAEILDRKTAYPRPGAIACEIVGRSRDAAGREIIVINTERPWCVESVEGSMQFEVTPDSLIEWDGASPVERAWSGRA